MQHQSSHRAFQGYMVHFSITKTFDEREFASFDVEIVLATEWKPSSPAVKLRFAGARDVRYGDAHQGIDFGDHLFLSVDDVANSSWEGIRFRVQNVEGGSLSLYCRDFELLPA